jgi:hypothetical protein
MHRARQLIVTAGAAGALVAVLSATGVGAAAADAMKPILVRDVREPFTVTMSANAGTSDPLNCEPIPLPPGELVIQNVNAAFTGPVDAYLSMWESALIDPPSGPPQLGRSTTYVRLEGIDQNLASNAGKGLRFEGLLRIADGFPAAPDLLFRDADNPVEFCAEDEDPAVGEGGPVVVSGYFLR